MSSKYRGTSLIRNTSLLGPYSRTIPRLSWWSWGGGLFLMSEVPLYGKSTRGTKVSLGPNSGVLRDQICTTYGPKVNSERKIDF